MLKRVKSYSDDLTRTIMALTLMGTFHITTPPESQAYKIEIGVSGPIDGHSVSEENGRTEIQLDTGQVIGPAGETGSAYATANLATGSLLLKISATTPDQSPQSGMGLASIYINDHLTFKLDPGLPFAEIEFSMRVDGSPSCENLSSNCFTNAIIRLGDVSNQALGLPLPDPKTLRATVTVFDEQVLPIEAFLSAKVETNKLIDVSDPSATIRLTLPEGVSFTSESGVFLGLQPPLDEPSPRVPVSSDLNGDAMADIVWRNVKTGVVGAWLMDGGKIASSGFLGGVPLDWQIEGVGDVNDDGMADIVWHHTKSGAVAVWFLNGLTVASVSFPGSASINWQIQSVGDVNADGKVDVLWRNTSNGEVAVWLMNGTTMASYGFLGGVPLDWQIVGMNDVNADGQMDIMWRHNSGVLAVWLMNGLTITSVEFPGGATPEWEIAGFGDVDGNRTTDVIWRNTSNGEVAVWLMNGATMASYGILGSVPLEWHIAQVGDVDGDGKADIIWHSRSSGQVAVWIMDGLTLTSTKFPGST